MEGEKVQSFCSPGTVLNTLLSRLHRPGIRTHVDDAGRAAAAAFLRCPSRSFKTSSDRAATYTVLAVSTAKRRSRCGNPACVPPALVWQDADSTTMHDRVSLAGRLIVGRLHASRASRNVDQGAAEYGVAGQTAEVVRIGTQLHSLKHLLFSPPLSSPQPRPPPRANPSLLQPSTPSRIQRYLPHAGSRRIAGELSNVSGGPGVPHSPAAIGWPRRGRRVAVHMDRRRLRRSQMLRLCAPRSPSSSAVPPRLLPRLLPLSHVQSYNLCDPALG